MRSRFQFGVRLQTWLALVAVALACAAPALRAQNFVLHTNAEVTGEGIFLEQVTSGPALPHIRLADAPAFGQAAMLTRAQLLDALRQAAPDFSHATNWSGAERIRVTRRARVLNEAEIREQLTAAFQRDFVRDKGDLELRLTRHWFPISVPDEEFTLKLLDAPASGVSASFIARFELSTTREKLGTWQAPVTAKVWREVWVARSSLKREQNFAEADVARERRDVLGLREPPFAVADAGSAYEIAESVQSGAPLYARTVRLRPVVRRGMFVDAQLQDGPMTISLRVEVLDSAAPGQFVRVRNPQSKRELRGKVKDEQTIIVTL